MVVCTQLRHGGLDFGNLVDEERCELISQLSGGVMGGQYGFFVGVEEFIRNLEEGTWSPSALRIADILWSRLSLS